MVRTPRMLKDNFQSFPVETEFELLPEEFCIVVLPSYWRSVGLVLHTCELCAIFNWRTTELSSESSMTETENTIPQFRYQITSTQSGVVGTNERGFCKSRRSQAAAPHASESPKFVATAFGSRQHWWGRIGHLGNLFLSVQNCRCTVMLQWQCFRVLGNHAGWAGSEQVGTPWLVQYHFDILGLIYVLQLCNSLVLFVQCLFHFAAEGIVIVFA